MAFTPRLTAPSETDKRWISNEGAYGGYNECLVIDDTTGSVLPNCTGYVHGRWMEIGNTDTEYKLSTGNAVNYYGNTGDGYTRGSEPKLGACACYSTYGGEPGHVCVVEQILDNDTIVTSESDYGGARFSVRTRYRNYGWNPSDGWDTTFQGFIYHPDVDKGSAQVLPTPGQAPPEKKHSFIFMPRRKR